MERIYSEKGKVLTVYNKYMYRQVNQLKLAREERWRCTKKDCKAKIFTLDGGNIFSRTEDAHNHEPLLDQVLNRRSISNAVKRKAENIDVRPSKLIHTEVQTQKKTIKTLTRKDIKCIRNNINYTRLKTLPKLPKSSEEIQFTIDSIEIKTIQDENFLLRNEKENGIVIFSCDSNLEYLCQNEIVLMDGTFEYAPKHFLQLFTVHGYFEGSYIPLVFCLLKDKKKQRYIDAMRILKDECEKRQLHLQPLYIVIDFEQAIHECIVSTFPQTKIVGCRFHLAQAWWRKIQKLGLAATYKDENSDGGKWLHYCFGLTYLRPKEVEDAFCDLISIQPADTKLTSFADYLTETYIDVMEQATFPPRIWAADSSDLWRTTNACESFHSRFNSSCASPHPNIFVFVQNLKLVQTDTYIRINSVREGNVQKTDSKSKLKQSFIEKKLKRLGMEK